MAEKKYLSLERLTEYDALIKSAITSGDSSTLNSAKSYTNTEIAKITGGTTVVPEATHATSADSATTASKAAQWTTGRKITLGGDASGNVTIDGTKDVTLTVTVADDSHAHVISNIDGLQSALDGKAASGHNHNTAYDALGAADTALNSAKSYADGIKNDLLNGAGTAYDTLKELGDLIDDNKDAIDALETIAAGKADAEHSHAIADVSGLQSALDGKAASSHGTHVSFSNTAPVMDGTASVGTATTVARSDHKHPTDTSRASQAALDALEEIVDGKASASHTHAISEVTNLQSTLDGKAASSHTHGNITNAGAIGTASGKAVITTTNGVLTTGTVPIASGGTGATTAAAALTNLGITATAAEINKLDGVTATTAELNYVDGVTSNIQTQLNAKVPTSRTVNGKALSSNITLSASDVSAYSKTEIDNMSFITTDDIDAICGGEIGSLNYTILA